jgi:putative ABC transport system substrate-binding protein
MKKSIVFYILAAIGIVTLGLILQNRPSGEKPQIAIITTLSHPALLSARDGFISSLRSTHRDVQILEFNAEGNVQQANLIAQQIAQDNNVIAIFAIGTLAAQTIAKLEPRKPIVIAAVSDPGAVVSKDTKNVCGFTDNIDANYQLTTITDLLPNVKSLSLLYSPAEANSVFMVDNLVRVARTKNITTSLIGVFEPQQITLAALNACKKSDAIVIPLDNLLAATIKTVIKATADLPCPIITSNESPIHVGATIAFGVDYEKSGQDAAILVEKILKGEEALNIGFIAPSFVEVFINDQVIKKKGVVVNPEVKISLRHVEGEV